MNISTILDLIDLETMALPEFQRGYVWNRNQVRSLMHSLYHRHPIGGLLVWITKSETANARGTDDLPPGTVQLLLDGQQRMTSLYGIIRGKPPRFFDGNVNTFTGLYFNLDTEEFEFYASIKMRGNPSWINVTELMKEGAGVAIARIAQNPDHISRIKDFSDRLNCLDGIKNIDLHIDQVTGENKTVDVVVDIFNRVNSGGTKLSKGDLALAKICAEWPEARDEMKVRLRKWENVGFNFKIDMFLRSITTIITHDAYFSSLVDISPTQVHKAIEDAEKCFDKLLNLISSRLGLDHDLVLGSRYSFPLLSRYMVMRGGELPDPRERDQLLFWYIHTFLWGRYAGSTESVLNRDLECIRESDKGLEPLLSELRHSRGNLTVAPEDFHRWGRRSRFYPLLYMLTRVNHSKDWYTGNELNISLLGSFSNLELHHIFPKSILYQNNYGKSEVNAVANFTFLTKETNLKVSNREPEEYLSEVHSSFPGVLESHWIPLDPELWKIDRYTDFLEERCKLLADTTNDFLDELFTGGVPEPQTIEEITSRIQPIIPGGIETEEEEDTLNKCNEWVKTRDLIIGELLFELPHPESGEVLAVLDLAWPDGLQPGLTQPLALLLNEPLGTEEIAIGQGFMIFRSPESFRNYLDAHFPEEMPIINERNY